MSTDLCVPAYLGAGPGTWREEGQSQSHIPSRRPSTILSAFPPGTSATRLAAPSTTALDHEYLKGGPGVLLQSVWGVVAEKEQRFGVQPRVTRSAYSRRRSLSGAVKRGRKEKGSTKKLVKGLEGHDSQTAVEILGKENTQPNQPQPIEAEDEGSSTIVGAIDTRLSAATSSGNSEQSINQVKDSRASSKPPTSPTSPPPAAYPHPPIPNNNMSSRSSRHHSSSTSSTSSSSSHSHSHTQTRSSTSRKSFSPSSPKPTSPSPSSSPQKLSHIKGKDKEQDKTDDKDDWHQIHEPEQRRRIQNRIAQRKFREKARCLKDQAARDAQNRRYAGCAYTCPEVGDLPVETYEVEDEDEIKGGGGSGSGNGNGNGGYYFGEEEEKEGFEEREGIRAGELIRDGVGGDERLGGERMRVGGERVLSGLPWGGLSMRFVVGRGHEYYRYQSTSRGGSGSGSGTGTITSLSPTITSLNTPTPTPTSGDTWPALQQQPHPQHQRSTIYHGHATAGRSGSSPLSPYGMMMPMGMDLMSGGDMDMDMDVDYAMAGTGAGGEYVTSPMAVTPGSGSGSGGHGGALGVGDGMDMTYYDSSPYYYGYGRSGGGGDAANGSGGSVYGGHGGRGGRM